MFKKITVLAFAIFASAYANAGFACSDIKVKDAYARSSSPNAKSAAAFFVISNHTDLDDRLIEVRSDVAKRVELHTHIINEDGVMLMRHAHDGFSIAAGAEHALMRGGNHVMFMGLNKPFVHGEAIDVILVFEKVGEVQLSIPIDLERNDMSHLH